MSSRSEIWPSLPLDAWADTYLTLHLWMQIVGKVRLKLAPFVNHWWETALYLSPRGLRTSNIPFGHQHFEVAFDFLDHGLTLENTEGVRRRMELRPRTVADFYREFMALLKELGVQTQIDPMPKEMPLPLVRLDQDETHSSYDREYAERHWRALEQISRPFEIFRGGFVGKSSPVHFFWGSFDLALTRFSGRPAPARAGADHITQVGYSHEVISCGFWPGSGNIQEAAFYAYAAPEPADFPKARILPSAAFYNPPTYGFVLPYETVRKSSDPDGMILEFCQSTFDAAASLGNWDKDLQRKSFLMKRAA